MNSFFDSSSIQMPSQLYEKKSSPPRHPKPTYSPDIQRNKPYSFLYSEPKAATAIKKKNQYYNLFKPIKEQVDFSKKNLYRTMSPATIGNMDKEFKPSNENKYKMESPGKEYSPGKLGKIFKGSAVDRSQEGSPVKLVDGFDLDSTNRKNQSSNNNNINDKLKQEIPFNSENNNNAQNLKKFMPKNFDLPLQRNQTPKPTENEEKKESIKHQIVVSPPETEKNNENEQNSIPKEEEKSSENPVNFICRNEGNFDKNNIPILDTKQITPSKKEEHLAEKLCSSGDSKPLTSERDPHMTNSLDLQLAKTKSAKNNNKFIDRPLITHSLTSELEKSINDKQFLGSSEKMMAKEEYLEENLGVKRSKSKTVCATKPFLSKEVSQNSSVDSFEEINAKSLEILLENLEQFNELLKVLVLLKF